MLVPELNDQDARMEIASIFYEKLGIAFLGLPAWDEIFEKLFLQSQKERMIVVFDEFQRFFRIDNSVFHICRSI